MLDPHLTASQSLQQQKAMFSHLALGPGGLASMPPRNPAAKDTASGSRPTSALMRNQVGSAAPADAAPQREHEQTPLAWHHPGHGAQLQPAGCM